MAFMNDYQKLATQHGLPSFENLQHEFEIDTEDQISFPLRHVRRRISEHLDHYAKLLEDVMQAEPTVSSIVELKHLDEEGKQRLYTTYRRIMMLLRESIVVALSTSDKEEAAFIKRVYAEWGQLKKELSEIVTKLKDSWTNDKDSTERLNYFG